MPEILQTLDLIPKVQNQEEKDFLTIKCLRQLFQIFQKSVDAAKSNVSNVLEKLGRIFEIDSDSEDSLIETLVKICCGKSLRDPKIEALTQVKR